MTSRMVMIAFEKPNEKRGTVRKKYNAAHKEHLKPRACKQDHLDY